MDWKYKHFTHEAIFKANQERVLDAARAVVAETLGHVEDTADGLIAQGYGVWHGEIVTFHITPDPNGTKVAVELLVQRASMRGYMLVDIGGYYNGQINKWFLGISQRLGAANEQILVSKTTSDLRIGRGCITGCLVYLIVGVCLVIIAIPLDHALFSRSVGFLQGPLGILASFIGLLAGVVAFLFVVYPDASLSKSIRERLPGGRNQESR